MGLEEEEAEDRLAGIGRRRSEVDGRRRVIFGGTKDFVAVPEEPPGKRNQKENIFRDE